MAQTTRLVSSGPILVVTGLSAVAYFVEQSITIVIIFCWDEVRVT
jgi:hypothetical protein